MFYTDLYIFNNNVSKRHQGRWLYCTKGVQYVKTHESTTFKCPSSLKGQCHKILYCCFSMNPTHLDPLLLGLCNLKYGVDFVKAFKFVDSFVSGTLCSQTPKSHWLCGLWSQIPRYHFDTVQCPWIPAPRCTCTLTDTTASVIFERKFGFIAHLIDRSSVIAYMRWYFFFFSSFYSKNYAIPLLTWNFVVVCQIICHIKHDASQSIFRIF